MLRVRDHESPRTPQVEIPQVVQCPLELFVPIGLVTTMWTRLAWVDAPGRDDFWRWQVGNRRDPLRGIGSIRTRPEHGCVLRARMFGPPLYDKGPSVAISKPGEDAIVSKGGNLRGLLLCEFARKKENPSLERYITPPYVLLDIY